MNIGILERIEFKLDAIAVALSVEFGSPAADNIVNEVKQNVAQATTTTNSSIDFSKWDFSVLDKDGVPGDERIHGKAQVAGAAKGVTDFKLANSGYFSRRRNLDDADRALVLAELKEIVAAHAASGNVAVPTPPVVDTAGTIPPPPPPVVATAAGTLPPPPPPTTAAVVDDKEGLKLFINAVNKFIEDTNINTEVLMQYLSDTYGFSSFEQVLVPNDRADIIIDLGNWAKSIAAAKAVDDKIRKIYATQPAVIETALQGLYNCHYKFSNKGQEVKSNNVREVTFDDVDSVAGKLEDYYLQIGSQ